MSRYALFINKSLKTVKKTIRKYVYRRFSNQNGTFPSVKEVIMIS